MSKILQTVALMVVFGAGLMIAGCGSSESPSNVVNEYHQAIMDKNVDAVMALSAEAGKREDEESLVNVRAQFMKELPPIVKKTIDGDTAKITCKFGPVEQDVDMIKIDGKWKVK